jgi:Tol biopolymer transport system component
VTDCFVHDRQTGQTTRVSVSSLGVQGNSFSSGGSISADGRYVAFQSDASNLVPGDGNGMTDCFVHDLQTGATTRVSVNSAGVEATGFFGSFNASISADGRHVAFDSFAANLVAGDGNNEFDCFVHDLDTGVTARVSVDSSGVEGNADSGAPTLSENGRYVAFGSDATNLVAGDLNGADDCFVHDRQTGQTTRVSVDSGGIEGNGPSGLPMISSYRNARYVAFTSSASNLVTGDGNGVRDCFVHDRVTGETTRVSVDSAGVEGNGNSSSLVFTGALSISSTGRHVAFQSDASNLVAGDGNGATDVFVHIRN